MVFKCISKFQKTEFKFMHNLRKKYSVGLIKKSLCIEQNT